MDDSGAILCQISSLKDMLDQVNEENRSEYSNHQRDRVGNCEVFRSGERFVSQRIGAGEDADSRSSVKLLEEDLRCLRVKRDEIIERMINSWEGFTKSCLDFQRNIEKGENDVLRDFCQKKSFLKPNYIFWERKTMPCRTQCWHLWRRFLKIFMVPILVMLVFPSLYKKAEADMR
ncbi:hypothetical protein RHMOL_Rhmol08G0181200 [Rhododendron molle]|uniref:Uncharacterized protein n=1 Tax=Rhododendron molle TaxID=49168 RepID=A0ACC0MQV7_RHOML|nr:hypothetical protein RHMOL_Rhmol08G0181200 [Rhododendron molle]